jgi:hypothetical protein
MPESEAAGHWERLPASVRADAIRRQVESAGGMATVLAKGQAQGGALLIVHRWRGAVAAFEKLPSLSGEPVWRAAAQGEERVATFVAAQQRFDPDLWVLELDIAEPARFVPGFPPSA